MITLTCEGAIARLTLDRPAKRNALTLEMWRALPALVAEAAASQARVLVLCGAGGHFAAGADIGAFDAMFGTQEQARAFAALMEAAMGALAGCAKPVIAQIEGACIGGGCGLALACDIRVAASTARLGITPGRLGLAYSLADTRRLANAVGLSRARLLLYTGRIVPADEALAAGLVDEVAEPDALGGVVARLAGEIATASATSVRIAKATLGRIVDGAVVDTAETRAWFAEALAGADFQEGRAAFLEKRPARFTAT